MRIYKAFLDSDFNVLSYEEPTDEKETIFSYKSQDSFEVDLSILQEYLGLNGYVTTYKKKDSDEEFVMYLDSEYKFDTVWDNETSLYVLKQIKQKQREGVWKEMEKSGAKSDDFKPYIHTFPGIEGMDIFKVGEKIHLKHNFRNGLWLCDNEKIAEVDRHTGLVKAKKTGKAIISFVADTGLGMVSVFHKIQVI
jgi:hypothetical protein